MKFDLRKAIEKVALREGTEKMSWRDVEKIIYKKKLRGNALPMYRVMGCLLYTSDAADD